MAKPEDRSGEVAVSGQANSSPSSNIVQSAITASGAKRACGPLLLICLGFLSGPIAGLLTMRFSQLFKLPEGLVPTDYGEKFAFFMDSENSRAVQEQLERVNYQNTLLTLAIIGAALSGVFGLAEGIRRRSFRAMGIGMVTGILAGLVLGGFAGIVAHFTKQQLHPFVKDSLMYVILAVHAAAWAIIGSAVGLAISLMTRQPRVIGRSVAAGVLAGPIVAFLFLLLGVFLIILFNNPSPDTVIPSGKVNQLCWTTIAAVTMGLFVGIVGRLQGRKQQPAATV